MATVSVRIEVSIHSKITEIARKENKGIQELTELFLKEEIRKYASDEVLETTELEKIFNNRLSKVEDQILRSTERLASLLARVGIDNSMDLMGTVVLLEKLFKSDRKDIFAQLRKEGVTYFSTATKEDKEKRNKEKADK